MADAIQGSPEHYKGMYGSLKFPPFKQQEYPKVLYRDEGRKQLLGTANNAMEEKELYASIGVEKSDIDPMGAAQDEIAQLKAKLAQYEGSVASQQIAAVKTAKVQTSTVEMLPEDAPTSAGQIAQSTSGSVSVGNPLLKPAAVAGQTPGKPSPVGSAPKVTSPLNPGV